MYGDAAGTIFVGAGFTGTVTRAGSGNTPGFGASLLESAITTAGAILDGLQLGLDGVGLVPGAGEIADGVQRSR